MFEGDVRETHFFILLNDAFEIADKSISKYCAQLVAQKPDSFDVFFFPI